VAESQLRRIVLDLRAQRREIDRAVAALEAVINGKKRKARKKTTSKETQRPAPNEKGNGTTGKVVPFVRGLRMSDS
jgi:hypothetical protein